MLAITVSTVIACMHLKHYSCRNWPTVFCVLLLGHSRPPIMGLATRRLRWRERARTENVFRRRRKVDRDGVTLTGGLGCPVTDSLTDGAIGVRGGDVQGGQMSYIRSLQSDCRQQRQQRLGAVVERCGESEVCGAPVT